MILIDTAPLVALSDPRDSLNKTAIKHLKTLARSDFAICEPVLAEACFHLSARSQRRRLQQLLERLDVLPITIDDVQSFWKDVFDWMEKYADHEPDWASVRADGKALYPGWQSVPREQWRETRFVAVTICS